MWWRWLNGVVDVGAVVALLLLLLVVVVVVLAMLMVMVVVLLLARRCWRWLNGRGGGLGGELVVVLLVR